MIDYSCTSNMDDEILTTEIDTLGFKRLESPNDGDCFFYSLETYFKLKNHDLSEKSEIDLRTDLVESMLLDPSKFYPFVVKEYKTKNEYKKERLFKTFVEREIKKLLKPGIYNTDLGDIIPQEAAIVFNVKLIIYNWSWVSNSFTKFVLGDEDGDTVPAINLLRINENHFDLLYLKDEYGEDEEMMYETLALLRDDAELSV